MANLTPLVAQFEVLPWGASCAACSLLVSTPVVLGDSQLKRPLGFEAEQIFDLSFPVVYQPSNTATELAELEPKSGGESQLRHPAVIAVLGKAAYAV